MTETKRLYRSRNERMLGGVCGGLAEYLAIDPTIVRLLFVLLVFPLTFGTIIIVYLILLIVVPEEPELPSNNPPSNITPSI
ncbi:MAG TPA: PspC domain-containing protein [Longilinea sp.]|nr:PspC domain-containing protein [Longilinea sp.]